jgi:hypothetical protein
VITVTETAIRPSLSIDKYNAAIEPPKTEPPNEIIRRLAEEFHQTLKNYKGTLQCDVADWGTPIGNEIIDWGDEPQ